MINETRKNRRLRMQEDFDAELANEFSIEIAGFEYNCNSASFVAETLAKVITRKLKKMKFLKGTLEEKYNQIVEARDWLNILTSDLRDAISDINNDSIGERY